MIWNSLVGFCVLMLLSYLIIGIITSLVLFINYKIKIHIYLIEPSTYSKLHMIISYISSIFLWPMLIEQFFFAIFDICHGITRICLGGFIKNYMLDVNRILITKHLIYEKNKLVYKDYNDNDGLSITEEALQTSNNNMLYDNDNVRRSVDINFNNYRLIIIFNKDVDIDIPTIDFLKSMKHNEALYTFEYVPANTIKNIQLGKRDFDLVFPEDIKIVILPDSKSAYVVNVNVENTNLIGIKSKLYSEYHVDDNNTLFIIDYYNNEAYAINGDNKQTIFCKYEYFIDINNKRQRRLDKFIYNNIKYKYTYDEYGILEKIDTNDNSLAYLRTEMNELHGNSISVTYVVPYIRTLKGFDIYGKDNRLYCTQDAILDNNKISEMTVNYRKFTDKEEKELINSFIKTIKNLQ